jgi:predicted ribosome quality control (RQC) complex YloA/Tae2 family protein
MNNATIEAVTAELAAHLVNRPFGKIFQIARLAFAIDFRLPDGFYLFIGVEPAAPRVYLIKRRLRDLEKLSTNPSAFVLFVRKRLSNAILQNVTKDANERIVRFALAAEDEIEGRKNYTLVAQLTGRSANLFLLDENDFILDALRENSGAGQEIATKFSPPIRGDARDLEGEKGRRGEGEEGDAETRRRRDAERESVPPAVAGGFELEKTRPQVDEDSRGLKTEDQRSKIKDQIFPQENFETLSEALDAHYVNLEAERAFQAKAKSVAAKVKQEITKREKLVGKLRADLQNHGDAEHWKRLGDLILANLADAVRIDGKVLLVDYFDDAAPTIEVEIDENLSLTEAAEKFFRRYTKARNAKSEIAKRLEEVEAQISGLKSQMEKIEKASAEHDEDFFDEIAGENVGQSASKTKAKRNDNFTGARRFVSSDGLEILVGKGSKDNDYLTFRVAKSLDFWLHAADYAGSHVVVRNPNRMENLPPKTLLEAAELAAFYSQGKTQPKAAVNYTQKKFVNKPKGAAVGLVSLSSFKTVLVEPKISLERQ